MKKIIRISDLSIEPQLSREYDMRRHSLSYRTRIAWLSARELISSQKIAHA